MHIHNSLQKRSLATAGFTYNSDGFCFSHINADIITGSKKFTASHRKLLGYIPDVHDNF